MEPCSERDSTLQAFAEALRSGQIVVGDGQAVLDVAMASLALAKFGLTGRGWYAPNANWSAP